MWRFSQRRMVILAAACCAALGATAVLAGQAANASGGQAAVGQPGPRQAPEAPQVPAQGAVGPRAIERSALRPAALATNATCGQVVTKSLTLNGDLLCSGNGLTVSGTSVTLNLNGHTLFGTLGYIGILVTGTTDTVKNGVVGLFSYGVEVQGTTDTVSTVQALFNQVGIADSGTSTKLTGDTAARNSGDGIDSGAAGIATYSGDHELSNAFNGLSFTGTAKITISSNVAESNGQYGITGGGGTLTNNVANFNGFDGIHIQSLGVTLDGGGNVAKGNNWVAGQKPYQCEGFPCS